MGQVVFFVYLVRNCFQLPFGAKRFYAVMGTKKQQIGGAFREQPIGNNADDLVDRGLEFSRFVDLEIMHVEDYVTVVGNNTFAVNGIAA